MQTHAAKEGEVQIKQVQTEEILSSKGGVATRIAAKGRNPYWILSADSPCNYSPMISLPNNTLQVCVQQYPTSA
jgi:hypothetical protein